MSATTWPASLPISEAIAEKALELIDVEYEVLPAYFDPEESMKAETDLIHDNKPHNLEKDYHHVFGDPDKGFAEADCVARSALHRQRSHARRHGAAFHAGVSLKSIRRPASLDA